jgi:hypothetical protein
MSASRYLVAARATGDLVQRHLDITDFVEDGVTRFKITYDTTQRNSARGRGFQFITILVGYPPRPRPRREHMRPLAMSRPEIHTEGGILPENRCESASAQISCSIQGRNQYFFIS